MRGGQCFQRRLKSLERHTSTPLSFPIVARSNPQRSSSARSPIDEAQERFTAAWGQMAGAWGISRTMAEVHALLYVTGEALCTDDVMEHLQISRGNASMSLRALQDWGLITRVHKRGDRKEYFEAESDVWTMFRTIARERKKRELDPLLASLYEIRDLTRDTKSDETAARINSRLDTMLDFVETIEAVSRSFLSPDGNGLEDAVVRLTQTED
jgi:DNA-binding transcriptional regulator GbsR (MarR family)